MDEIELIKVIGEIAQSITVTGILIYWVSVERRARKILSSEILEDWKDLKKHRPETSAN